jgi:hypothetical protein
VTVKASTERVSGGETQEPILDERGMPVHHRGVKRLPGLFVLGLPFLYTRGSALLGWVAKDAKFLANRIADGDRFHPA